MSLKAYTMCIRVLPLAELSQNVQQYCSTDLKPINNQINESLHTSQFTLQSFGYLLQRIHLQIWRVTTSICFKMAPSRRNPFIRSPESLTNEKITLLSYKDNVSVGPSLLNKEDTLDLDASLSIIYNNIHFSISHIQTSPFQAGHTKIQTKATPINIFLNKSLIESVAKQL